MSTIDPLSPITQSTRRQPTKMLAALKKITLRKVLLKIHLYISLWLGAFLVLAGLTGSLLVYSDGLDHLLNSDTMQIEAANTKPLPYAELIATANTVSPIKEPPSYVQLPNEADEAMIVRYQVHEKGKEHKGNHKTMNHHFYEVMINPYTGQVLGSRDKNDSFMSIVRRLHANLLVGETGKLIMGITALLTLVLTITGIYLWWPKLSKIKQAFTIKRNASFTRFNIDLHKTSGIYTAVILFSIALSGVYFNLPNVFKPVVNYFSPMDGMTGMSAMMGGVKSEAAKGTPITPEMAVNAVTAAYPDIQIQRIFFPADAEDTYRVTGRQADEVRSNGSTAVWLDQYSGKFIKVRDPHQFNAGNAFTNLQLSLHNGEILGSTGRVMVLITGFAPLLLMVTGVTQWLKKRKAKQIHDARLKSH